MIIIIIIIKRVLDAGWLGDDKISYSVWQPMNYIIRLRSILYDKTTTINFDDNEHNIIIIKLTYS